MFRIEMLPACEGDCLILSWGPDENPKRILIDAGRAATAGAVLDYAADRGLGKDSFELFVITHIDRDHIEGAVALMETQAFRDMVKEVWFNGRADLEYAKPQNDYEKFGALDGERLSTLISANGVKWNESFGDGPIAVIDEDSLPQIHLPDDMTLTILSPDLAQLKALIKPWDETLAAAPAGWELLGEEEPVPVRFLAEKLFKSDAARPNGSSIAFVAEHHGRCVLLTGDAHVPRLIKSIRRYLQINPDACFAAVKASHHGSRGNTSTELVKLVDCPLWLFSTNGAQFQHPDPEAVARVIWGNQGPSELVFNYRTKFNSIWTRATKPKRPVDCEFGSGSVVVDVPQRP